MDKLVKAINISGTTDLIISKVDIVNNLQLFKLIVKNTIQLFENISEMISFVNDYLLSNCILLNPLFQIYLLPSLIYPYLTNL